MSSKHITAQGKRLMYSLLNITLGLCNKNLSSIPLNQSIACDLITRGTKKEEGSKSSASLTKNLGLADPVHSSLFWVTDEDQWQFDGDGR